MYRPRILDFHVFGEEASKTENKDSKVLSAVLSSPVITLNQSVVTLDARYSLFEISQPTVRLQGVI